MLTALEQAKRNGARIIAVNPLPEAGLMRFRNPQTAARPGRLGHARWPTCFLQIRVNGDLALFQALNRLLLERDAAHGDAIDHDFVDAPLRRVRRAGRAPARPSSWPELLEATGLARDEIEAARAARCSARSAPSCAGRWA